MQRYPREIIDKVRKLRSLGKTYGEIRKDVRSSIPKSTLSDWCKNVKLPKKYIERLAILNKQNLDKGRRMGLEMSKIKREEFFQILRKKNSLIAKKIEEKDVAKMALAMLCLGEASKYKPGRSFNLSNSDHRIITLFIELLKTCFDFNLEKVRCTVQCRADQDTKKLEKYWMNITGIPKRLFYKSRIDPRTKGKPTKKKDYMGVLRVDYLNSAVQHDLESLGDLLYNFVSKRARSLPG